MGHKKKEKLVIFIGAAFILVAALLNEWVVAELLSFSGDLSLKSRVVIWSIELVIAAIGILLIIFNGRIARNITTRRIIYILIIFLLILLGLELSARIINSTHNYDFTNERDKKSREIIPFRTFGPTYYERIGSEEFIKSRHAELYPLEKEKNVVRIVVFGGSTTENLIDGIHYPLLLEKKLQDKYGSKQIEVINVANSAYATPHSLITLMLDVSSWDPDIVIMSHNINDLTASYFPELTYDYSNKYGVSFFIDPEYTENLIESVFGWSTFYWISKTRLDALNYNIEVKRRGSLYMRKSYGNTPPEKGIEIFRRNLKLFISTARTNNIDVIISTQPLEPSEEYWDKHMKFKPYNDIAVYPQHEEFVAHHNMFNDIIRLIAREEGAYLIDNQKFFNNKKELFSDFVHYKKEGIEEIADNYFNFIVSKRLVN